MEWTVAELAARAGISGRALRHYHRIGLLDPDRVGRNGYRYYGPRAVARLQRILLLRGTGIPLAGIAEILNAPEDSGAEISALETHLEQLAAEQETIRRRIRAVEHTLAMRRQGRRPRMDVMLDGFNDRYEDEVVRRWGREAFDLANQWWHGKSIDQQRAWKRDAEQLLTRWRELYEAGEDPGSDRAQAHALRHIAWFTAIPGTPTHAGDVERSAAMIRGMAAAYASTPDFHDAFGSKASAEFAAQALQTYLDRQR